MLHVQYDEEENSTVVEAVKGPCKTFKYSV